MRHHLLVTVDFLCLNPAGNTYLLFSASSSCQSPPTRSLLLHTASHLTYAFWPLLVLRSAAAADGVAAVAEAAAGTADVAAVEIAACKVAAAA